MPGERAMESTSSLLEMSAAFSLENRMMPVESPLVD